METDEGDMNTALMVDGNAIAGQLQQIFGRDMTMAMARCAACAREAEMGALMVFTQAPGVVLRCPACQAVIARIVENAYRREQAAEAGPGGGYQHTGGGELGAALRAADLPPPVRL